MSFQTADKIEGRKVLPTGITSLDSLLEGGLELGLTYLFYGDKYIRDILHRILVHSQHSGFPPIIIDSGNTINVERKRLHRHGIEFP